MGQRYDLAISGGGPAGSAAAWRAATTGARVVVLDHALFPRDKPCGASLTPRAVYCLQTMGLAAEVAKFHRANRTRVFSPREWDLPFPRRPGMPDHGHVVRRSELDTLLLRNARSAGVEVREAAEVMGPIAGDDGRITGVLLKTGEQVLADAVIAADGAYSPITRALKRGTKRYEYSAIAIRAEVTANRPDTDSLDIYLRLAFRGDQLPGYGWVFPLGGGRVNIGLGYVNSYRDWLRIDAPRLLGGFLATLPAEWALPRMDQLKESEAVQAWPLPLGFSVWPPWRPGVLFAGDALGAARPMSGAGICAALQSGLAAGECAVAALTNGGADDFSNYADWIQAEWGRRERGSRCLQRLAGIPAVADAAITVLDSVNRPASRARRNFVQGRRDARRAARWDR